jgi:hypothetical protein
MAAVTPNVVQVISARVDADVSSSGTLRDLKAVYVDVTSTAADNTLDLDTYVDGGVDGIVGVAVNSVDGATSATSPTWSSSTLTLAQHAGSGGCKMIVWVY